MYRIPYCSPPLALRKGDIESGTKRNDCEWSIFGGNDLGQLKRYYVVLVGEAAKAGLTRKDANEKFDTEFYNPIRYDVRTD